MKQRICLLLSLLIVLLSLSSCGTDTDSDTAPTAFSIGFSSRALTYDALDSYYIAGYHNGNHPTEILDPQQLKAVWIGNGARAVLLLSVDCIGLDSGTVADIRHALSDFRRESGCDAIHVISTHTHAGVDTLGLWGPVGINGKNEDFIARIVATADAVAREAYAARQKGELLYSATPTRGLQRDSRDPQVYDASLYQLRFVPYDETSGGVRIVSFAAHAEALRGDNRAISADLAGALAEQVRTVCGDELIFLPGAIGGLIMTPELVKEDAVANLRLTAERLAAYVLHPTDECVLPPTMALATTEFETDLENTLFLYYKFLGILGNDIRRTPQGTYRLRSEVSLLQLGDITLVLLPGEVFPELISGTDKPEDGEGFASLAARYGVQTLIPIGLANDELGYILPQSDFILDPDAPYVLAADGHYEETNSVGPNCAADLRRALEQTLNELNRS